MDVVDRRRYPDDLAIVDGDGKMVPRVGEELGRPPGIDALSKTPSAT